MSDLGIVTDLWEWKISLGRIVGVPEAQASVWVAFNSNFDHVEADNFDHLIIAIHQFEHPEECK